MHKLKAGHVSQKKSSQNEIKSGKRNIAHKNVLTVFCTLGEFSSLLIDFIN